MFYIMSVRGGLLNLRIQLTELKRCVAKYQKLSVNVIMRPLAITDTVTGNLQILNDPYDEYPEHSTK